MYYKRKTSVHVADKNVTKGNVGTTVNLTALSRSSFGGATCGRVGSERLITRARPPFTDFGGPRPTTGTRRGNRSQLLQRGRDNLPLAIAARLTNAFRIERVRVRYVNPRRHWPTTAFVAINYPALFPNIRVGRRYIIGTVAELVFERYKWTVTSSLYVDRGGKVVLFVTRLPNGVGNLVVFPKLPGYKTTCTVARRMDDHIVRHIARCIPRTYRYLRRFSTSVHRRD